MLYLSQRTDHPGWDESCLAWELRGRCKVVARVQEGRGEAPATLLAPGRYRDLTQGHLRDQVDQVGEGLFEGGGEAVAGERVPANAHAGQDDWRGGAVEGLGQGGQGFGGEVVGPGGWGGRGRVDPAEQDRAGRGLGGGVDQDDQGRFRDLGGEFGGELVTGQDPGAGQAGSAARRAAACQPAPSSPRRELP